MTPTLRIGTRGSPLALWQADAVASAITRAAGPPCEIVTIKTTGDRLSQTPLADVGGKAVFVKEIEAALLANTIDLAVHSAKDLPSELPIDLTIASALPREDARDALALPADSAHAGFDDAVSLMQSLGEHPRVGTGSVRRAAQLAARLPGATFEQIRGNVGTRLRKLDDGECDLLVLAAAGLVRLGLTNRISARLSVEQCVPAPGQGIVAIEARADDRHTLEILATINDAATMAALQAERTLLQALGGDCHVPIGGVAQPTGRDLTLRAVVASVDGSRALHDKQQGSADAPIQLGRQVASTLIEAGAADIIAEHRA